MAITTTTTGRGKRWQPQLFAFTKNFSTFSCYPLVFFVLQHGHRHRPTEQIVNEKVFMLFSVCRGRNRRLALSFFPPRAGSVFALLLLLLSLLLHYVYCCLYTFLSKVIVNAVHSLTVDVMSLSSLYSLLQFLCHSIREFSIAQFPSFPSFPNAAPCFKVNTLAFGEGSLF